jgi:hypothetical protein
MAYGCSDFQKRSGALFQPVQPYHQAIEPAISRPRRIVVQSEPFRHRRNDEYVAGNGRRRNKVWTFDLDAHDEVIGGGIVFKFDLANFGSQFGKPELLPDDRGWSWGGPGGTRVGCASILLWGWISLCALLCCCCRVLAVI